MSAPPPRGIAGTLTFKLCLAGDYSVGKTSLVRRFVSDTFSDRYIATLGAKVSSKQFAVEDRLSPRAARLVRATIWDIMGQRGFRDLFHDAFFLNAKGVLLVADATRPETLHNLVEWANSVESVAGTVGGVVLLNKTDLVDEVRLEREEMDRFCKGQGWQWIATSAKTGAGVEEAFRRIAEMYLDALQAPAAVRSP